MSQQKHSEPPLQITAMRSDRPRLARCSVTRVASPRAAVVGWHDAESPIKMVTDSALLTVTHLDYHSPLHPLRI